MISILTNVNKDLSEAESQWQSRSSCSPPKTNTEVNPAHRLLRNTRDPSLITPTHQTGVQREEEENYF